MSPTAARDDEMETWSAANATTPPGQSVAHHETFSDNEMNSDTSENTRADVARNNSDADDGRKCLRVLRSSLWTNYPFITHCVLVAAVQGCHQSFVVFLPARGRELGAGPKAAALLPTLLGVCDMAGRFTFGFVFDLRAVRRCGRCHVYAAVAASFGVAVALTAAAGSYASLATCTCVSAVFTAAAHSQKATVVTEMVEPSQMAHAVGLVIFSLGFGSMYGPVIGG